MGRGFRASTSLCVNQEFTRKVEGPDLAEVSSFVLSRLDAGVTDGGGWGWMTVNPSTIRKESGIGVHFTIMTVDGILRQPVYFAHSRIFRTPGHGPYGM